MHKPKQLHVLPCRIPALVTASACIILIILIIHITCHQSWSISPLPPSTSIRIKKKRKNPKPVTNDHPSSTLSSSPSSRDPSNDDDDRDWLESCNPQPQRLMMPLNPKDVNGNASMRSKLGLCSFMHACTIDRPDRANGKRGKDDGCDSNCV